MVVSSHVQKFLSTPYLFWTMLMASLMCSTHDCFKEVSISNMRRYGSIAALISISYNFSFSFYLFSLCIWRVFYPPISCTSPSFLSSKFSYSIKTNPPYRWDWSLTTNKTHPPKTTISTGHFIFSWFEKVKSFEPQTI